MVRQAWRRGLALGRSVRLTLTVAALAFFRAGGPTEAAALAFYALLASIPLFFLLLALYGLVTGEAWTGQMVLKRQLEQVAPFVDEVLVSRARRLLWAAPGMAWESVVFILWSSWLLVGALRRSLARPWREARPEARATLPARLAGWAWGAVVGVLFVAACGLVLFAAHLPRLAPAGGPWRECSTLWGVGCLTGLYGAVYLLFLPRRRPLRVLFAVAAGLAVAAYGVSVGFAVAVAALPRYRIVYGSLSGAVLFLLWLDYHACLLLGGAWFLRCWQREHPPRRSRPWPVLAGLVRRARTWRRAGGGDRDSVA